MVLFFLRVSVECFCSFKTCRGGGHAQQEGFLIARLKNAIMLQDIGEALWKYGLLSGVESPLKTYMPWWRNW